MAEMSYANWKKPNVYYCKNTIVLAEHSINKLHILLSVLGGQYAG